MFVVLEVLLRCFPASVVSYLSFAPEFIASFAPEFIASFFFSQVLLSADLSFQIQL